MAVEAHGPHGLAEPAAVGLIRLHLGLASGHEPTLRRPNKGAHPAPTATGRTHGRLPQDRSRLLAQIEEALTRPRQAFRPDSVGTQ